MLRQADGEMDRDAGKRGQVNGEMDGDRWKDRLGQGDRQADGEMTDGQVDGQVKRDRQMCRGRDGWTDRLMCIRRMNPDEQMDRDV